VLIIFQSNASWCVREEWAIVSTKMLIITGNLSSQSWCSVWCAIKCNSWDWHNNNTSSLSHAVTWFERKGHICSFPLPTPPPSFYGNLYISKGVGKFCVVVLPPKKKPKEKKVIHHACSTTKTCYLLCAFGWDRMMDAVMGPPVSAWWRMNEW
jgi:hypothetical protein